ncbi:MAG: phospholipase [Gemmatimonadota bacterium]
MAESKAAPDRVSGVTEHHLTVARTARYYLRGDPGSARHTWLGCHGYGQLAATFIGHLATAAGDARLLVAPEALSRFYHDNGLGPIGASWMTREDRANEIADYIRYLDQVQAELRRRAPTGHRLYGLGFSQGVATVSRWVFGGESDVAGLIMWAGTVAPELNPAALASKVRGKRVALVAGTKDEYVNADWFQREHQRFVEAGADCRDFSFHGGHRLDRVVLAQAMDFVETG